jgi:hypothetical protein
MNRWLEFVPAFVALEKLISSYSDLGLVDWRFFELEDDF